MKISRNTGFYQINMQLSFDSILKIHGLKTFMLYSQNKLFTKASGFFFFFKDVFTVFLEIGLGIKNPIVYLLTDFIKL